MKIAPFRLLSSAAQPVEPAPALALLGLSERELSPRAKAKLLDLMADIDRMGVEAERLTARVAELEALADTDPLANVMNRRAFMRELSRALAFASRHGGAVSVLYLDLDGFKAINDAHGHRGGDAMIVHVSEILKANLRETDAVARLGGDEFGMVLPCADEEQARTKAADLSAKLVAAPLMFEGARLAIDASIGVYQAQAGDTAEGALKAADASMYARKRAAV